jgi:hypothetical protein
VRETDSVIVNREVGTKFAVTSDYSTGFMGNYIEKDMSGTFQADRIAC